MKFPEKYIDRGNFELHSGGVSNHKFDVVAMVTDPEYIQHIVEGIPRSDHYVGITTGGALMAQLMSRSFRSKVSYVQNGVLHGDIPEKDNWVLIDDVVTTGNSLEEAISAVGKDPGKIYVAVDRREPKNRRLEIHSIFEI